MSRVGRLPGLPGAAAPRLPPPRLLPLLLLFLLLPNAQTSSLWCHQGGSRGPRGKEFEPTQCPEETLECYKFQCRGGQDEFVTRGCGVSIPRTAMGLVNESCHQAAGVCEYLGGESDCERCSDKHLCNSTRLSFQVGVLLLVVVFLSLAS